MGLINPPDPDLASTSASEGASLIGIADSGTLYTATTVEGALAEVRALVDTNTTNGVERVRYASLVVGHADLTAAATSESIDFAEALPAGARVLDAFIDITTLFSGGSVSALKVDVGVSGGDTNGFIEDATAFTGDPTGRVNGTRGVIPNAGGVTVAVNVKATGDNVVNLDAGAMTVYVVYSVIDA